MIDLTGQKFGRLVIIQRMDNDKSGHLRWLCKCDCGKKRIIRGDHLKSDETQSCGCLRKEVTSAVKTTHGYSGDETYKSWLDMKQRCTNSNCPGYKDYGGRGITVCEEWSEFTNFFRDMGKRPLGCTIERENNHGNYCLDNCKWATSKEQARNRRNNLYMTHKGETQLLIKWSEETRIPYKVLWKRIYIYNWSTEEALTIPVRQHRKKL